MRPSWMTHRCPARRRDQTQRALPCQLGDDRRLPRYTRCGPLRAPDAACAERDVGSVARRMTNSVSAPALDGERMLGAPLRIHASGPETAGCHSSLGRPENSGAGQVGSTNVLASLTGSGMSIPCMLSSRLTDEVFNGEAERFIQTLLREWA